MEHDTEIHAPLDLKQDVQTDSDTPVVKPISSPLLSEYTLRSCMLRFVGAAFIGMFIDIVIFCLSALAVFLGYRLSVIGLYYALIEVPLICGILGIFFFDEIFDVAAEIARKIPWLKR